jgi:prepilin-type N-terminal cleavage/methylation domain-containing protein
MMTVSFARPHCSRAGFTLIELVIASTIISIVMLGAYATLHAVVRNWRGAEDSHAQVYGDAQTAKRWITRDLRAIPTAPGGGIPDARYYFIGTPRGFECITMAIPMNVELEPRRQLLKVAYRLRKARGGGGMDLVRTEFPVAGPFPIGSLDAGIDRDKLKLGRSRDFVVAHHVTDFVLEYMWPAPLSVDAKQLPLDLRPVEADRAEGVLPKGFRIRLTFYAEEAVELRANTSFTFEVSMPGDASPVPPELLFARSGGPRR